MQTAYPKVARCFPGTVLVGFLELHSISKWLCLVCTWPLRACDFLQIHMSYDKTEFAQSGRLAQDQLANDLSPRLAPWGKKIPPSKWPWTLSTQQRASTKSASGTILMCVAHMRELIHVSKDIKAPLHAYFLATAHCAWTYAPSTLMQDSVGLLLQVIAHV